MTNDTQIRQPGRLAGSRRRITHAVGRVERWQTILVALIGSCATIAVAVIGVAASAAGGESQSGRDRISVDTVSFSEHGGAWQIEMRGTYKSSRADGYLLAIAILRVSGGRTQWFVSEPIEPDQDGRWVARILLAAHRQSVTVLAFVPSGGCAPGNVCGANPEALRQALEN
ncbi:hypothetical protein ACFWUU_17880 [Kribbella sp. NPDC058693]|uniref:Uncharacterized protein n=1 Tax=Kribbella jiaozuonensis TaxID=2575441 RepID=A0A4U3LR71_9ACTN|nr:hypothetical protein [Kribbella jiaozuonensis]TKK78212.1 hypothetical protein FDA38_24315 [Kribbella jiaozuonensis]